MEPVVYHGYTLTTKILFKEVITTVEQHAFEVTLPARNLTLVASDEGGILVVCVMRLLVFKEVALPRDPVVRKPLL